MRFELKNHKLGKIKSFFKNENLIFLYHSSNLNSEYWITIEQKLIKYNLVYYKLYNTLFKKIVKKSIFYNLFKVIHGPIMFINVKFYNKKNVSLNELININQKLSLLCFKLKKKIYITSQISAMKNLKYIENINSFNFIIKIFIKNMFISNFLLTSKKRFSK